MPLHSLIVSNNDPLLPYMTSLKVFSSANKATKDLVTEPTFRSIPGLNITHISVLFCCPFSHVISSQGQAKQICRKIN